MEDANVEDIVEVEKKEKWINSNSKELKDKGVGRKQLRQALRSGEIKVRQKELSNGQIINQYCIIEKADD